MSLKVQCFSCGTLNEVAERIGRRDECEKCSADLHACKNCRFYDPSAYNECQETSADVVREKEESNFCDYFEPGDGGFKTSEREALLARAESLFKKD